MTKLGELLGTMADKLAQDSLNIGDVHFGSTTRLSTAQRLLWPREVNSIKILIVGLSPIQK